MRGFGTDQVYITLRAALANAYRDVLASLHSPIPSPQHGGDNSPLLRAGGDVDAIERVVRLIWEEDAQTMIGYLRHEARQMVEETQD